MKNSTRSPRFLEMITGAVLVLCFHPAAAQDCPELLGLWPYGPAYEVAVAGSTAYVGSGPTLLVVDVSVPASPQLLGEVTLPEIVSGVAVVGSLALVVDYGANLRVIDVSIPSAPVEVGIFDTLLAANGVAVAGSYAYVAGGSSGLRVISIANPSAPAEVGSVQPPGYATGVAVVGSYAYVAYAGDGLRVISIANPSAPVEVGAVDTPGWAVGVAVAGSHAYVADFDSGLRVISIANPAMPSEVAFVDTQGYANGVAVTGNLAFVAGRWAGLRVVDVSTPDTPSEVGFLGTGGNAWRVAAGAGLAYVADDLGGLVLVDVSAPSAPTSVGSYLTAGYSQSVAAAADLAYVGVIPATLRLVDVSAPTAPVEIASVATRGYPLKVVLSGWYAFLAELSSGLEIFDLGDPHAPVVVGWLDTPGQARGVAIAGGYAYIADGTSGLRVVDVSVPGSPVELGVVDTPGAAYAVAVDGDYAYVADEGEGLRVIDISNPGSPIEVGSVDTPDSAYGVAVAGNYAFVADNNSGVRVIDVSVPTSPLEVGLYDTPGAALDITVMGDLAYVADRHRGVLVLDISTPATPVVVGSYDTAGQATSLALANGTLMLADYDAGVAIFDDCQGGGPPGYESFVPAAAVAAGAQGAFFSTDLEINNTGTLDARVDIAWLPRGEDNSAPVQSDTITLAPGRSVRFANVLGELFGLGPDSFGALRLTASTAEVIAMSRTYNSPDGKAAGTFGQGLPAIPADAMIAGAGPQRLIFLSENPDSRANVGCVNGSSEPVRVTLAVFDDEGSALETRTMDLGPYSNDQINRIFRSWAPINGYVDVSGDGPGALFYCYGSMLDNLTSDPTTILPQTPSATTSLIPAAALAAGLEGAFFQTDVDLNNAGSTAIGYQMLWLPRGADNSNPTRSERFSLAPGGGVRYANVLDEVFGLKPDRVGAVAVEADGTGLLAMSRTYNLPPAEVAGTFGQGLAGIPADRMIPTGVKKRIIFLDENDDVRANLGCANGGAGAITVSIRLFSPQGRILETRSMNLPPRSNDQITRVFRTYSPITGGYVDVSTATPGASFTCYGSVLDNLTSDPTTVPPQ
jgi:hypothetical protein